MRLDDLNALSAWMRATGAVHVKYEDAGLSVEIVLGDTPHAAPTPTHELTDEEAAAALEKEKERLERLLFASSEGYQNETDDT